MSLTTSTIVKLPIAPVCLNRSQSLLLRKSNSHSQAGWTTSACIRASDRQRLGLTHLVDRSTHLVRRPHLLPLTRPHFWIVATDRPRLNEPGRPLTSRTSTFRRPSLSPRFSGCAKKENKKAGRRSLSPPSPSLPLAVDPWPPPIATCNLATSRAEKYAVAKSEKYGVAKNNHSCLSQLNSYQAGRIKSKIKCTVPKRMAGIQNIFDWFWRPWCFLYQVLFFRAQPVPIFGLPTIWRSSC